jgi:hypothetical protein
MSRHPFALGVKRLFASLGSPAQYSTVTGETIELKVISKAPDSVQEFGQSHLAVTSNRFDLQAADITRPQEGDRLTWRGVIYVIQGDGLVDRDRLIWTVSAYPLPDYSPTAS